MAAPDVIANPPAQTPDNTTIQSMRTALDKASTDLQTKDTELTQAMARIQELENEKLTETQRLQNENKTLDLKAKKVDTLTQEIEQLKQGNQKLVEFINGQYESKLASITDETQRTNIQTLTFVEGDPIGSLSKLDISLGLVTQQSAPTPGTTTPTPIAAGTVTVPPGGNPQGTAATPTALKPSEVTWGMALKPIEQLQSGPITVTQPKV